MEDEEDDFEEFEEDAENGDKVGLENQIAEEPLAPPPKRFFRLKLLSFSFVAVLLVLVGLINVAMIVWFLTR